MNADTPDEPIASFDWNPNDDVIVPLLDAIAAQQGRETTDVPLLYPAIDPEALNALFRGFKTGNKRGFVCFEYAGYDIVLHADGRGYLYAHTLAHAQSNQVMVLIR